MFSADSLRLDLLRLGREDNPLVSVIGSPEWRCRDIGPGSPLAYTADLVRGEKSTANAAPSFPPVFPVTLTYIEERAKRGGGLLCCAREYLAVPMFLLGAEKGGGNGTFAAVPASFSFLPPLSGLCFRLTSFHPRRRRRQCAMLTFPPLLCRPPSTKPRGISRGESSRSPAKRPSW